MKMLLISSCASFLLVLLAIRPTLSLDATYIDNARNTFEAVLSNNCLHGVSKEYSLRVPSDIDAHYEEIMRITAPYRGIAAHSASGTPKFSGPWIENHFISNFSSLPLSYFRGFVPLFVQWSDYDIGLRHNLSAANIRPPREMFRPLLRILRDDVLYMTVAQANDGLEFFLTRHRNVVVFSAGGDGNVAIPLIKGELPVLPIPSNFPQTDVGFYGSLDHGPREVMMKEMMSLIKNYKMRSWFGPSKTWINQMSATSWNLAPRGFGRASFRLSEIIQMGRVPVYLYDDRPWLPYEGTKLDPTYLGLVAQSGHFNKLLKTIASFGNDTVTERLQRVKDARFYYTYEGVIEQIHLFIRDPHGPNGGFLRCAKPALDLETVLDIQLRK